MHLSGLQLENFRNHTSLVQTFSPQITLIHGPNGAGKTNILEAIYLLSTGKSNRAGKVTELVNWDADIGRVLGKLELPVIASEDVVVARQSRSKSDQTSISRHPELVSGSPSELASEIGDSPTQILKQVQDDTITQNDETSKLRNFETLKLEITLTRGSFLGQKTPYKKFTLDGVARSQKKFAHQFNVVWFGPADMRLIEGSPTRRRDFLDETISQINPEYAHALRELTKLLPRRNQVLFQIREGTLPLNQLKYWDQQLCLLSEQIHTARQALVDFINHASHHPEGNGCHPESIGCHPELVSGSQSEPGKNTHFDHYYLQYTPKTITFDELPSIRNREIAAATTLRGPHRDEFDVLDTSLRGSPLIASEATHRMVHGEARQSGSKSEQTSNIGHPELVSGSPSELASDIGDSPTQILKQVQDDTITQYDETSKLRNFETEGISLRTYGSRGQQRMAIIWLKLMALEYIAADRGVRPILLLDDVMSELDSDHRTIIQNLITKQQTIITSAEHLEVGQTQESAL